MSVPLIRIGRALDPRLGEGELVGPDWAQASVPRIRASLRHALALPCGGWYVVGPSGEVGKRLERIQIADHFLVAWRTADGLAIGFDECPHMGAPLSEGKVCHGEVVCPWHGLSIGARHGAWRRLPVHDDGVLTWVRLDPLHAPGELTVVPRTSARPARALVGIVQREAACDPSDVLANRLDPWHGVHFHPQAFASLRVTAARDDLLVLRVAYRVLGPLVIEVDASFHCPDPRTIVMTIVAGEGRGSIVETHATPMAPGRTRITEVTLATSERAGFRHALRLRGLIRPFMERIANGLWEDDVRYAERTYALRTGALARHLPFRLPGEFDEQSATHDAVRRPTLALPQLGRRRAVARGHATSRSERASSSSHGGGSKGASRTGHPDGLIEPK